MKKMNWFLVVIMLFGACFAACTDDDDNGGSWDGESVTVDCDPYDAWSYFSFKEGKTVKTLKVRSAVRCRSSMPSQTKPKAPKAVSKPSNSGRRSHGRSPPCRRSDGRSSP